MALFSNDNGSLNESVPKGLAQLGAAGAAFGTGKLLRYPIDASYQRKLVQKALELNTVKEQSRDNWDTMVKLYTGKLSMNDLPEERREFYKKLLQENMDDLKYLASHPYEVKETLEQFDRGKVIPLFGDAKMTHNFPDKVHSPTGKALPGLLGLAGYYSAGELYDHLHNNDSSKG